MFIGNYLLQYTRALQAGYCENIVAGVFTADVLKASAFIADKGVVLASSRLSAEHTFRVRDPSLTMLPASWFNGQL